MQQQRSPRGIILAIITGLCALSGTLATVLPESPVQEGAEKVANVCEANGFRAWPEVVEPTPPAADDAGTVLPTPLPSAVPNLFLNRPRVELGDVPGAWPVPVHHRWHLARPRVERWPGESRGWA